MTEQIRELSHPRLTELTRLRLDEVPLDETDHSDGEHALLDEHIWAASGAARDWETRPTSSATPTTTAG